MAKTRTKILLERAFALDRTGREAEAIPIYRQAIRGGLRGKPLRDALVCLGSSLHTVGRARQAVRCLQSAKKQFPDDAVVELFLALALHDLGKPEEALRLLAGRLLTECEPGYRHALRRKFRSLGNARKKTTAAADRRASVAGR